ncbi:hypothetical protein [Stenotrophomonas maltophilia]|uniref:hypothetical protein n=1 Tax=Stenotrophomonas maltophilia TaxID=40324 RepID=UPI00163AC989|nr:hypothetical protein [Stenotrophomonas maltophilia]QNG95318.1 hypothetical protein AEPCKKLL_02066 [Stenotrophomonas maltophilia]
MSLVPTVYRSTDVGAPLLSGVPGAMLALLDAILVDGYGTGAGRKDGLGWTKEFGAVNVRVYRNSPVSGTGYYLRVDDTAAKSCLLRGYSSMSDVNTGEDATPSLALKASGSMWEKANSASSAIRHWIAIGTERFFYLFVDTAGYYGTQGMAGAHGHYAGDIASMKPGDRHHFVVSYKGSDSEGSSSVGYAFKARSWNDFGNADTQTAAFIGRSMSGMPGSVRSFVSAAAITANVALGNQSNYPSYPYIGNGGLLYSTVDILENNMQPRGFLPGIYAPIHRRPFPELTVVTDVDGLPVGTQLLAKCVTVDNMNGFNETYSGQILIDITNAWG